MSEKKKFINREPLVPLPTTNIVPERDADKVPVLECRHLGIDFGGLSAVNDFNIALGPTEISGLIGPNGAGKTTVFNLLTKVYEPTRGTILLNGVDTHNMTTPEISQAGIGRTFQNIRLFKDMSVLSNVLVGMHYDIDYNLGQAVFRLPKFWKEEKKAKEKARDLLSIFNMQDLENAKAGSLPYGAQRRLEIIRALATNPKLLLLDEPAAGMNPQETAALMDTIKFIRDEFDLTILLIEHDMKLVAGICEELTVLNFGQVLCQGDTKTVLNDPEVIKAYLGD